MLELSNTTELRREGPLSWFRSTRTHDGAKVILKTINLSNLPTEDIESLQQKITTVQLLDEVTGLNSWIVEKLPGELRLVTRNPAGLTLRELIDSKGRLNLYDAISIAETAADATSKLHNSRIVLCNISPDSILLDDENQRASFFDLDAALIADQRRISTEFGGTQLEYISPEQTGRTSRQVQAASDLYSLGVVLYECLTGRPPFTGPDPMQIIHGHIASMPRSVARVDTSIPSVVSAIVDKLLAKEPGDRYLSAGGLSSDLRRCREMLDEKGEISDFGIAEMDEHSLIMLPRRLYGRTTEMSLLSNLLDKSQGGNAEFLFVEGPSGIGKTALIETVADQIKVSGKGSFVSGKFDQLFNVPYKAFFECFTSLTQQLLAQDPKRLGELRKELLEALAGSGQLLVESVPDLETVLGKQPPLEDLPPTERENRFRLVCRQFFQAFASRDHPLTVFIDDLQWADAASLTLIEYLVSDPGIQHFYFIGASRPQETANLTRFTEAVSKLSQSNICHLSLTQLSVEEVRHFLMDTLGVQEETLVGDLAAVCFEKTQGNPFFLQQFLLALSEEGLIVFDFVRNCWEWKSDRIKQLPVHEDVALLFAERLQLLSLDTLNLLQWGACLGNRFDIEALASIERITVEKVRERLRDVVRQGLVLEANTLRLESAKFPAVSATTYQFAHDRILEAVYKTLTKRAQSQRHYRIGELLIARITSEEGDEGFFSALNQIIRGFDFIHNHSEPKIIARRFLSGAQRAKSKAAYELGLEYLKHGINLLPSDSWISDYELTYDFHLEQMEAEYLNGNFDIAEQFFSILRTNSRSTIEKLKAYNLNVQMLTYMTKFSEAIASGIEGLKLNGINIASPFLPTFLSEVLRARRSVKRVGVENFSNLSKLDNPKIEKSLEIMNSLATPTFLTDKNLFVINGLKMFNLTMRHGMSVYGPNSIMMYGVVNSAAFRNYDAAYHIAVPSMDLGKTYATSSRAMGRIFFVVGMLINWLKRPLDESIDLFEEGLGYSWASADLAYVGYHYFGIIRALFSSGAPLRRIERKLVEFEPEAVRLRSDELTTTLQTFERYLYHTTNEHQEFRFTEEDANLERNMVTDQGIGVFCLSYSHLAMVFDDVELNGRMLAKLEEMDEYVTTGFYYVDYLFQHSLFLTRTIPSSGAKNTRKLRNKLRKMSSKLDKIALSAGEPQKHKAALVQAEMHRLWGSFDTAMTCYDKAISTALQNGSYDVAAIASERASDANFERGHINFAQSYLRDAVKYYQEWGATAKVFQLRSLHGAFSESWEQIEPQPSSHQVLSNLDMASVLKASQAISGTIMQDELLQNLLTIVIENVGAQRGIVLLWRKEALIVEAEGRSDWTEIKHYRGQNSGGKEIPRDLPSRIVRYVERKREVLVLDDASVEEPFNSDPYFQNKPPCSVLCAPILLRGELIGMIYLENTLSTGAFTPDRSAVLEILCSQAAISIKNASLYSDMTRLNQAYERFVPQQFISLLEKDSITDVALADHVQRQMTILFLDVRDFTALSEKMNPKENFEFINALLGKMDPIIRQHAGFIDKYLGDGIMALFPTGADDAVSTSIEILNAIDEFNYNRKQFGSKPVRIGIGVHTGLMMLGTIGGQDRMDGTVISSAVNLASRLEDLNKFYGSSILISEDTHKQLAHDQNKFYCTEIDRVNVDGMPEGIKVYEVKRAIKSFGTLFDVSLKSNSPKVKKTSF